MSVTLNSALSGHVTADNPAINVVFPSSQEITISGPEDTITPVDDNGTYVALATEAKQDTQNNRLGDLTETAPASDTASSGLNGRLQRIAQRLTSLIALLPSSLGQKAMSDSLAVTIASDQSAVTTSPSGGSLTNRSGTATTTSSQIAASNTSRKYFLIQNIGSQIIYIDFGTAAVVGTPSLHINPGATFIMEGGFVSTQAINAIVSASTAAYIAKEG